MTVWNCKHCNGHFDFQTLSEKANHGRWCSANPKLLENNQAVKNGLNKGLDKRLGKLRLFSVCCDLCKKNFEVEEREHGFPAKARYFCSRTCANTKPPSQWHLDRRSYTKICFDHHARKCVVCGEDKIVEVHHLNENPNDNQPMNLIPLCPTHHQYWHSRYKHLVYGKVMQYIGGLAQLGEHLLCKQAVGSSILPASTKSYDET